MNLADLNKTLRASRRKRDRDSLMALAAIGPASIAFAFRVWELHAPHDLRGLLSGHGWKWDTSIQGYRGPDKKIIAGTKLKDLAVKIAESIRADMKKRTAELAGGDLPLFLWRRSMSHDVAGSFILMAALGAGGFGGITPKIEKKIIGTPRIPGGLAFSLDRLY